ncbi:radical SAM protein, partial [Candidatus Woesearchaeota archaeon]|nr:radical SAM protein [Candidatus Woesearchaeota archaeon]
MEVKKFKQFGNGFVYALLTKQNKLVETTDTYLPYYTINAVGRRSNSLISPEFATRADRWMIGISVSSGCPVGCKFCATGNKFYAHLTAEEMFEQVEFIVGKNPDYDPRKSKEFKVLFTRMGEPALNYPEVNQAIEMIKEKYPNAVIGLSTIGINNAALDGWLELSKKYKDVFMQFSLHTTSEDERNELIPFKKKMNYEQIRDYAERWMAVPNNKRKVALNFTILEGNEFSMEKLEKYFPKENFFIKLSPLNENKITIKN